MVCENAQSLLDCPYQLSYNKRSILQKAYPNEDQVVDYQDALPQLIFLLLIKLPIKNNV